MNNGDENIVIEKNSRLFVIVITFLIFIIAVIGFSFATITYTKEKSHGNTISTGNIYLSFNEDNNGINITNAFPTTDETGKALTDENYYFDFSVNAKISGDVVANYEIAALKEESSTLSNDDVKLYLEKNINNSYEEVMAPKNFTPLKKTTKLGTESGAMLLYEDTLFKSEVVSYRLRMWVDSDTVIDNLEKKFGVRVSIKAKVDLRD